MKKLFLVRHAKSSWEFSLPDHDRPLTKNGIQSAQSVAQAVVATVPSDCVFWSSTAQRASHTAQLFTQIFGVAIQRVIFKKELYTFDESELEQVVKKCEDNVNHLFLFGHNEAITNFVNKFGSEYIVNVPTSGFVAIEFQQHRWKDIAHGKTVNTIFPKDVR